MRRFVGPVLLGLGAFLVVAGLLTRFYAYPALAVAPIDTNSVTQLEASDATIFDTGSLSEITTDLEISNRTVGDVAATEDQDDSDVVVYVGTTSIRSSDGEVRSRSAERYAFDKHTAEAVNCCGGFLETTDGEREPQKRTGLMSKFPFGAKAQDYKVWDSSLGAAVTAKYVKQTEIQGLDVYEFQADVPRTQVGQREVPASVLGEDGTGNTNAQVMYQNATTYWVEPTTGVVIDRSSQTKSTLAVDDEDRLTTTAADISYTDAQVKSNVDEYAGTGTALSLVKTTVPIVAVVAGLLLIGLGLLLSRRGSTGRAEPVRLSKS